MQITPADIVAFYEKQAGLLQRSDAMIIGGSAPRMVGPEVYRDLVAAAAERGVPVVLDASGPYLAYGLQGLPDRDQTQPAGIGSLRRAPAAPP